MRLTAEQKQRYQTHIATSNAIEKVPFEFQPRQAHLYPPDNKQEFERWFFENTKPEELIGKERTYLPVFWTGYYCNNGYGRKTGANKRLQHFIDFLPRTKTYWTICQYDDGCMVDFKDLDIKIFGMSGGRIDYPIPLLCQPHKYQFPGIKKDIFCSFVGTDTHPLRRDMVKNLQGKDGYYVTFKKHSLEDYCRILARSVFALCPRGYGKSSFRIQEAIQYGAVPVYISDEWIIPYEGSNKAYFLLKPTDNVDNFLKGINPGIVDLNAAQELFTYEACKKMIIENI